MVSDPYYRRLGWSGGPWGFFTGVEGGVGLVLVVVVVVVVVVRVVMAFLLQVHVQESDYNTLSLSGAAGDGPAGYRSNDP